MRTRVSSASLGLLLLTALTLPLAGCSGGLIGAKGEPWTIRCMVLSDRDHRERTDSVAEVLRNTAGIEKAKVRTEHGPDESTIYYGRYDRRILRKTRRLEVTKEMYRDMRSIKELGVPGQGHYFADARFVPRPSPDAGDPAWKLENANGVYTLRVAIFANEPGFYERKEAAAAHTALLRSMGYAAFFRHGPIHSEVYVGEFGEDALRSFQSRDIVEQEGNPWGVGQEVIGYEMPSPEVRALQAKETFAFELWNLRRRGERRGDRELFNASKLVRVQDVLEEGQW